MNPKMLKLLNRFSDSSLKLSPSRTSMARVSLYSTQAHAASSELYRRLQRGYGEKVPLTPVLDKWIVEGRPVDYDLLNKFIKSYRKFGRFKPALEVAEWMSGMKYFESKPAHIGIYLDLISKVHGIKQAEHYVNVLDNSLLVPPVNGALLNCYAKAKDVEKAEAVMDKIRKSNLCSNLDYNTMLGLYSKTGNHEKIGLLVQEMEGKGVVLDEFSYNIRLNAYATSSEADKMERLLMKMEVDPHVTVSCFTYVTVAQGYLKAGSLDKASSALKKAEHLIKARDIQSVYGVLIAVYTAMRDKENVYRLWNLLLKRGGGKTYYRNYACMITSLEKLSDLEGVGKIFSEWEEKVKKQYFDIRVPNLAIWAYCKKGQVREAEGILGRVLEKGNEPTASTWSHMALGYRKNGEMEKAVEMTKKALSVSFSEWKPDVDTVASCVEYLKGKGDGDGIREIMMLLEKCGKFSDGFKESFDRYANGDGDEELGVRAT